MTITAAPSSFFLPAPLPLSTRRLQVSVGGVSTRPVRSTVSPARMRSPPWSSTRPWTCRPSTNVPFREPRSISSALPSGNGLTRACLRDTSASGSARSDSASRPITSGVEARVVIRPRRGPESIRIQSPPEARGRTQGRFPPNHGRSGSRSDGRLRGVDAHGGVTEAELVSAVEHARRLEPRAVDEDPVPRVEVGENCPSVRQRLDTGMASRNLVVVENEVTILGPADHDRVGVRLDGRAAVGPGADRELHCEGAILLRTLPSGQMRSE